MSNNSDLRFVSYNKYVREPVKEYTHKGWVLNGNNNSFYQYLIDRYKGSTTHKAVCDSYINLTYGQGLYSEDIDVKSDKWKEFLKMFSKKDQRAVIRDFIVFNELSFQVIRQKGNRNKLAQLVHIDKSKVVPSIEDEDGNITSYWYSRDWKNQWKTVNGRRVAEPKQYPALGFGNGSEIEIYVAKPYDLGSEYFPDPEYLPILQYAQTEEEISNYYLKYVKNDMSLGHVINIPNSYNWSDEEKDNFIKQSNERIKGSNNAGGRMYSFNKDENHITIETIKNEYHHKQWDFLTLEARQQIMTGHKVTSSSLVGVNSSSGFSNTADEMDEAEHQLMKRVISPKQHFITDAINEVLEFFNIEIPLGFIPLTEKVVEEEKDRQEVIEDENTEGEEDVKMSSVCNCEKKKSDLDSFIELGEDEDLENFDLIDDEEIQLASVSTGTARPNAKSSQDNDDILIRYRYVGNPNPERGFCKAMMSANKVYRKEDIEQLTNKVVNPGFGMHPNPNAPYSIWLYKGGGLLSDTYKGGTCKHKWNRVIYLKKGKSIDVNSPLAKIISTSEARRKGYKVPTNDSKVSIAPHDM